MSRLLRIISNSPLPTEKKLAWKRRLLENEYAKHIDIARKKRDFQSVRALETDRRFEVDLHDEDEDAYVTKQLLKKLAVFESQSLTYIILTTANLSTGTKVITQESGILQAKVSLHYVTRSVASKRQDMKSGHNGPHGSQALLDLLVQ